MKILPMASNEVAAPTWAVFRSLFTADCFADSESMRAVVDKLR